MRGQARQFLQTFIEWADRESDILGVALVGSHARNEATELSDIDLVIITTTPGTYIAHTDWAQRFGTIEHQAIEDYGPVTSLRARYAGGPQVEYGFTDENWAASPIDRGTLSVISNGFKILSDRAAVLGRLRTALDESQKRKQPGTLPHGPSR